MEIRYALKGFSGRLSRGMLSTDFLSYLIAWTNREHMAQRALDASYSETYEQLKGDADLLLEGSEGRIRVVILVKISPLGRQETCCQSGFVEIHEYDHTSGTRRKRGQRKVFPVPWLSLSTILTSSRPIKQTYLGQTSKDDTILIGLS